jgi:hypothetical protein
MSQGGKGEERREGGRKEGRNSENLISYKSLNDTKYLIFLHHTISGISKIIWRTF